MALIKCPECGKEVSDKAEACIHCGYPLAKKEEKPTSRKLKIGDKYFERDIVVNGMTVDMYTILKNTTDENKIAHELIKLTDASGNEAFEIARKYGVKKQTGISCPMCHSHNIGFTYEPKTKTRYTANINIFRPLTFANKKEKTKMITKRQCKNCGYIFG